MEKLFLMITRWLMIAGAAVSFVVLIGGVVYELALYQKSLDKSVGATSVYHEKDPVVSLDDYKYIQNSKIEKIKQAIAQEEKERKALKEYILSTITNGSQGHGFAGVMPAGLLKGKQAERVAEYIVDKFKSDRPKSFAACAACHSDDGNGTKGEYPSLRKLPIYHGQASLVGGSYKYAPSDSQSEYEKNLTGLKLYSAQLAGSINKYSLLVDQNGTNSDEIYNYMHGIENRLDYRYFEAYKKQLKSALDEMMHYANTLIVNKEDIRYAIDWREYLSWSLKDFKGQISIERVKYQNSVDTIERKKAAKERRADEARAKFYATATILGITLIVFILFTIILVLFKIEANTRQDKEA